MIQVLDIYDGNKFDIEQELSTGTDAVIIKVGQGQWSSYFANKSNYIDQCKTNGVPYGVYWLYDARYSPESHKAALQKNIPNGDFGELGLWVDVEKPTLWMQEWMYRKLPYAFYKHIESFTQGALKMNPKVGIYTSPGQWNLCAGKIPQEKSDWFATLPLWTAQYKTSKPSLYGSWKKWLLWQYQGEPDYSVFGGTDEEFRSWVGENTSIEETDQERFNRWWNGYRLNGTPQNLTNIIDSWRLVNDMAIS